MRRRLLLGITALVAACAAAAAGAGGASTPPALFAVEHVSNAPGSTAPVLFLVAPTGDTLSASSVSVYIPAGYALDLTLAKATKIGIAATVPSFDETDLTVADPAAFTNDPCSPGAHAAVWTGNVPVAGVPTTVPIFVDPTSGTETARGAYRLTYCQPSLGIFELSTGLTAPTAAGTYTWHAFVTPPGVNGTPPDPNGVYELRSVVALPHTLKSKATYSTRTHLLTITGKATAAGGPEAGASVEIAQQKGTRAVHFGATKTRADGTFTLRKRVVQTAIARTLTFDAGSTTIPGDCADPPLAPAGCLLQTYASASDAIFKARIPAKPKAKPRER